MSEIISRAEVKRAYRAAYYAEHREKERARSAKYYVDHREEKRVRDAMYRVAHPEKRRVLNAKWRFANPGSHRKSRGLPEPTRPCPELCEVTGCIRKATCLDHDHVTGAFRGWTCGPHNLGIGQLGDNAAGVRAALQYLERAAA